jgi:2-methylisocitrate lyase-like PEP mutase family enzyme
MKQIQQFKELHAQKTPLVLGNVWDAHTAKLAEEAGFKALGSSSHAIAFAMGYADGEEIRPEELFFVIERIAKIAQIPLSVDFEAGYSDDPKTVAAYVSTLADMGVVGINLEDGNVKDGKRLLGESAVLADKISAIKDKTSIFVNARTDTYVTKHANALEETVNRAKLYAAAGADGIFVPKMEKAEEIKQFVQTISLPLNLFYSPALPDVERLGSMGVKRLSHGALLYDVVMQQVAQYFKQFKNKGVLPA